MKDLNNLLKDIEGCSEIIIINNEDSHDWFYKYKIQDFKIFLYYV